MEQVCEEQVQQGSAGGLSIGGLSGRDGLGLLSENLVGLG